jgi:hypothetical protein
MTLATTLQPPPICRLPHAAAPLVHRLLSSIAHEVALADLEAAETAKQGGTAGPTAIVGMFSPSA